MSWLVIILVMIAAWHYLWESAIAPSERLKLRSEIFRIRDEVRWLAQTQEMTDEVFNQVQESLNTSVRVLGLLDPFNLYRFKRQLCEDEKLSKEVERRLAIIQGASDEVKNLQHEATMIAFKAMVFNIGGWFIYLVPLVLIAWAAVVVFRIALGMQPVVRKMLQIIDRLIALTEGELRSVFSVARLGPRAQIKPA